MTGPASEGAAATVRPMMLADLPAVLRIETRVFANPWSSTTFENLLGRVSAGAVLWVAERDGVVAGYAVLWCILDQGELANIAVAPESQGRGYAVKLLEHALDDARERGVTSVFLEVRRSNERAADLYRGFGFEDVGVRRAYYSAPLEDARVMRWSV